jgi:hypothetical protein
MHIRYFIETHNFSEYITYYFVILSPESATNRGTYMKSTQPRSFSVYILLFALLLAGCASTTQVTYEPTEVTEIAPVPAGRFDTGRMWTFDFAPVEYFAQTYDFTPTDRWFLHARLASLRLPNCSASFVSGDGLVMTNHHCALGALERVALEDEKLLDDGFYAVTLEEERRVEGLYLDQLVLTEDVTDEVIAAFERGTTDAERLRLRQEKIREIEKRYSDETGLRCSVVNFYNGGRYSLYGYKRYDDVRLVYAPESAIGFFGGDPDNFTYPRYNLDVTFMRVYDQEGNPYKPEYYFRWSNGGAREGDAVFVTGNPGRTSRLLTVDQLLFNRDKQFPYVVKQLDAMVGIYSDYVAEYPEKRSEHETRLFGLENSQKAYRGMLRGLNDPELMGRKVDFETTFRSEVLSRPDLYEPYGRLWNEIAGLQDEKSKIFDELQALTLRGLGRSALFGIASDVAEYIDQAGLPEEQREDKYKEENLEQTRSTLFPASGIDTVLEERILVHQLIFMESVLGREDPDLRSLFMGQDPVTVAAGIMQSTVLTSREETISLLEQDHTMLRDTADPLIRFVRNTRERFSSLRAAFNEIQSRESARVQQLGRALYEIYGTSIPPDATFTLRIADGIVKTYEYNGTIAPPYTTFYGLYDRYYSHGKEHPWSLPERWVTPPGEFTMSTPVNFVSTNDIIGGNSGSPVINTDLEIVGLVFDGNIESLPGNFIFAEEYNRAVSVHSEGILEALRYMYDADRIVYELETGTRR